MFRTHLLRERYRVRRENFHRHEICKKKKRRKLKFDEIKDYVVAIGKMIHGKIRRIVLSKRLTNLERTSNSEFTTAEKRDLRKQVFYNEFLLKASLILSHLRQLENRASNDKIANIEFVR